jgi:citrate synthase
MISKDYSSITPELKKISEKCLDNYSIDSELYTKYDVKKGLRDINGKGVLAGLTKISSVSATKTLPDGRTVPAPGELRYRGINIKDLVGGFLKDNRFGFEETIYLLITGRLPDESELKEFKNIISDYMQLPNSFTRDIIMKSPSGNMMNTLSKSVLAFYSNDDKADDISIPNVLRQCLQLISLFPVFSVYGYQAYTYFKNGGSLVIHNPKKELSIAENILYMLRPDGKFTPLEAKILDLALVIHAEHGGGNNSTFTVHVVSSSGTDTYSTMAAALGSLKGPKHGGANIKVVQMFDDMKTKVKDWKNEDEIKNYLYGLLNKEEFDKSGLIYGMGHAVYSESDPRAEIFKGFVEQLSEEKGCHDEYMLYANVERLAPEVIASKRKMFKGVCANVDFYSGFVYRMLGIPEELFTPIFAIARVAGWSAHRIEEIINCNKIIRPAYRSISENEEYTSIEDRK